MGGLKRLIKTTIDTLGFEITKKHRGGVMESLIPSNPFEAQRELIKRASKSEISILDVGANKGLTVKRYRSEFPDANIHCFEPFPNSIAELEKQFENDKNIHIVPKAVADKKGISSFFVNEFDAANSLLPRPAIERRYYPKNAGPKETIEVETITLDEYLEVHTISEVDILKLDIQGGELNAMRGAEKLLNSGKVSLIYTEMMFMPHYEGAPLFHEIWAYLVKLGFSLFDIYDIHRASNGQVRFGDALFVSGSIRNDVINQFPEEP